MVLNVVVNMKFDKYDYEDYGAFKQANARLPNKYLYKSARMFGLKKRYLRFLKTADRNKSILEIGCGNGEFLQEMMTDGFTDVRGIEPSPTYNLLVNPEYIIQLDALSYFETCSYASIGTIVALDVFEHIPFTELHTLLQLIYKCLMPGGTVIFRVPNMASVLALANYFGDLSHVTALNEKSIQQLIYDSGLVIKEIYPEPFAYPRSISTILGILLWPFFKFITASTMAAFGIHTKVLTPNIVCVLVRPDEH